MARVYLVHRHFEGNQTFSIYRVFTRYCFPSINSNTHPRQLTPETLAHQGLRAALLTGAKSED